MGLELRGGIISKGMALPSRNSTKRSCRDRNTIPTDHFRCSLGEELEINSHEQHDWGSTLVHKHAALCTVAALPFTSALSALETIGRPRSELWDLVELYSRRGNLTAAVVANGLAAG